MTKELSTTTREEMLATARPAGMTAIAGKASSATTIEGLFSEWKHLTDQANASGLSDPELNARCDVIVGIERRIFDQPATSIRDLFIKIHMAALNASFDGWDADLLAAEARQALGADAVTV